MPLGNMRANGTLAVRCENWRCYRHAVLDVTAFGDDVPVPAFGPRMVCTACGAIGADAQPDWYERLTVRAWRGSQT